MTIRLINAKGVGDDLAAGRITATEQSLYLIASFLIWMIPAYLFLIPAPRTEDLQFFWTLWLIELAFIVVACSVGVGFCLRKCRVDPARNFLVDFSCLNAPISLTTLIVVWGSFYLITGVVFPQLSSRTYDIVRMLASAGAVFLLFSRVGKHMDRVSLMRESSDRVVGDVSPPETL